MGYKSYYEARLNKLREKYYKKYREQSKRYELEPNSIKNCYAILDIKTNSSIKTIKKRYRKLCMQYHPDRHQNLTDFELKEMEHRLKQVIAAYNYLMDNLSYRDTG